ncbi:MAG TPA: choice-of-anchor L domain-containing protein [Bacteroidales bacterium]|nr:choice-of-anchor L domain-containing protein [Bacteroidales bacterium]
MRKFLTFLFSTLLSFSFLFIAQKANAQLTVVEGTALGLTPLGLVQQVLVGNGVTVSNGTFNGTAANISSTMIGRFNASGAAATQLGYNSGIIITSGQASLAIGPNNSGSSGSGASTGSDPDLQALVPSHTVYDKAILEFDFIPIADTIKFQYVFGSEEFDEYCNSSYNDVFGFFVSGPGISGPFSNGAINIARMPNNPSNYVTINNVCNAGATYSWSNAGGTYYQYDRLTKVYTAWTLVIPCQTYHLKIAIGDCGDSSFDSGVFIKANSFSAYGVTVSSYFSVPGAGDNAVEACSDGYLCFRLSSPAAAPYTIPFTISGTATNGVDYTYIPNNVTVPAGQDSVAVVIHPIVDGVAEGTETVVFNVQTVVCGSGSSVTVNIIDNSILSAVSSNDTLICGDPATIWVDATGGIEPYTYIWDNGAGDSASSVVNPAQTTTYSCTVTDVCSVTATESVTITVGLLTADAGPNDTICIGQPAYLNASGGASYLWNTGETTASISISPSTTTSYYVTVYDMCDAVDSAVVVVNPLPTVSATANPQTFYDGQTSIICGSGGSFYSWTANPPDPSLNGQATLTCPVVAPHVPTTYMVAVTDSNGCQNYTSVSVNVLPIYPVVNFTGEPVSGCEPLTVHFTDHSTMVAIGATYFWEFGNGLFSYEQNPLAYYDTPGTYDVKLTVTNPVNLRASLILQDYITVYPKPDAIFSTSPQNSTDITDPTFHFFDHSLGMLNHWRWDFGDGLYDTLPNTHHCYSNNDPYYQFPELEDTGTYLVTLAVTTIHGCTDTTSKFITVEPAQHLYVPNAFTPNNDPVNERFCIMGYGVIEDNYKLTIYNRWGQLVYETTNLSDCWDGNYKDKPAETETYVYIISYMDSRFVRYMMKGTVTVFR